MAGEYLLIATCTDNLNQAQMFAGAFGYVGPNTKDKFLVLRTEAPQLQVLIEAIDATTYYIGESLPGTPEGEEAWRIKKVTSPSAAASAMGAIQIIFADDTAGFTKKWTDRATYNYSSAS